MSDLAGLIAACAALVVAVGGYVQFALRRSVFPCIEFDIDMAILRNGNDQSVGELVLSIKNVGPGVGFVTKVQARVRYRLTGEGGYGPDGVEPAFAHALTAAPADVRAGEFRQLVGKGAFPLMRVSPRHFIQPGVTHRYRKPLAIPEGAYQLHVWAGFEYHIQVGRITWFLARYLTARPDEPVVPYTVRRTFGVGENQMGRGARAPIGGRQE